MVSAVGFTAPEELWRKRECEERRTAVTDCGARAAVKRRSVFEMSKDFGELVLVLGASTTPSRNSPRATARERRRKP